MQINSSAAAFLRKDFQASITTSSGDKIDLSMAQNDAMTYASGDGGEELTVSSEQIFKLHMETNGLSAQDKIEIADAMKKINPKLQEFFSNGGSDKVSLNQTAKDVAASIEKPKTPDALDTLRATLQNQMQEAIKLLPQQPKLQDDAKQLLDTILRKLDSKNTEIYA